ncbi:MAG TPA: hypothetical protein VFG69_02325 [Nannocystaceae bacterium]|nr:hypothetical protein [Nannocystaceae bacterium]
MRTSSVVVMLALALPESAASARVAAPRAKAAAPAAAATESNGWAHVAVDTSETGEAGPAIRRRVQERADVVLRRAGILPGRGPQDPTINVVVREKTGDRPGWEYVITVLRPEAAPPAGEPTACDLCTETELVDAIEGRLATVAAELEAAAKSASDGDPTMPPSDPIDGPPHDGPPPDPKKLGKKGKAGAALIGLGGAGLIVGIVLTVLPPRPKKGDPRYEVFTTWPGYGLLASGGAALIVGAVLLGIDRRQAKRRSNARARIEVRPGDGLGFRF